MENEVQETEQKVQTAQDERGKLEHNQQAQFKLIKTQQSGIQINFEKLKNEFAGKMLKVKEDQEDAI